MPIYSANRTGIAAPVAESATTTDIGQILYESQLNDMAIFSAVIRNDFGEICRLREGTMLECEIAALNEGAVKEFFKGLQEKLARFWAKIKEAFRNAIDNLSLLFGGNGKKAVEAFKQQYKELDGDKYFNTTIDVKFAYKGFIKALNPENLNNVDDIEKEINSARNGSKGEYGKDYIEKKLGALCGQSSMTIKEYQEDVIEKNLTEKSIGKAEVDNLCHIVENGKDIIKSLKDGQRNTEKAIYAMSKKLKEAEYKIEDNKDQKVNIRNINGIVSAYESIVAIQTRLSINIAKASIKNCRKGLMKIIAEIRKARKEDTAVAENAILLAEAEVDEVFFNNTAICY